MTGPEGWRTAAPAPGGRALAVLSAARTVRGVAAGALSVVFALELARAGYSSFAIGVLLGAAMGTSALWSLALPGRFAGMDRARLLLLGAGAVALGGVLLWWDLASPWVLGGALAMGGLVAGGSDISPLGALEQGALAHAVPEGTRTRAFVLYNFLGYLGTAVGALVAAPLSGWTGAPMGFPASPRDAALLAYGLLGLSLFAIYPRLTALPVTAAPAARMRPLSPASRGPVVRLSALFAVDAFGGGLIANALLAYFLLIRFGASGTVAGLVVGAASAAAGVSLLLALPLARKIGLLRTMVFTHLPSSGLLIAFAFAPTLALAAGLWVARATISQMDVPTRQSYTQALVPREEGAAAAGYTTAARSAQALGGPVAGALFAAGGPWTSAPFALAGSVKIAYDLVLYRGFRHLRPPEERPGPDRPAVPADP